MDISRLKKITISILFVFGLANVFFFPQPIKAAGTTYYVNSQFGNDSWSGSVPNGGYVPNGCQNDNDTSDCSDGPWKSLNKVNSQSFQAGDRILFRRWQTFTGSILPTDSGQSGSYITYGAYGTGDKWSSNELLL